MIQFVDSEDPEIKSTIQRHTAYHSAAQRRDARLQSLRQGAQSRYLEWGRREQGSSDQGPSGETVSSPSRMSPVTLVHEADGIAVDSRTYPTAQAYSNSQAVTGESSGERTTPTLLTASEEELIRVCGFYFRSQHQVESRHSDTAAHLREMMASESISGPTTADADRLSGRSLERRYENAMAFMRRDEACTQLLMAYCHSMRAAFHDNEISGEAHRQAAQNYLGRGTNMLSSRLRDAVTASSDANVQAVLLLVSYAADFGQRKEVDLHADALRTMVAERGGLEALKSRVDLYIQLKALDGARRMHLTLDCYHADCHQLLRFPGGFWAPDRSMGLSGSQA